MSTQLNVEWNRESQLTLGQGGYQQQEHATVLKKYRACIEEHASAYVNTPKGKKRHFAAEVLDALVASEVDFVEKDKDGNNHDTATNGTRVRVRILDPFDKDDRDTLIVKIQAALREYQSPEEKHQRQAAEEAAKKAAAVQETKSPAPVPQGDTILHFQCPASVRVGQVGHILQLVRDFGGTVSLETANGVGLLFRVVFPPWQPIPEQFQALAESVGCLVSPATVMPSTTAPPLTGGVAAGVVSPAAAAANGYAMFPQAPARLLFASPLAAAAPVAHYSYNPYTYLGTTPFQYQTTAAAAAKNDGLYPHAAAAASATGRKRKAEPSAECHAAPTADTTMDTLDRKFPASPPTATAAPTAHYYNNAFAYPNTTPLQSPPIAVTATQNDGSYTYAEATENISNRKPPPTAERDAASTAPDTTMDHWDGKLPASFSTQHAAVPTDNSAAKDSLTNNGDSRLDHSDRKLPPTQYLADMTDNGVLGGHRASSLSPLSVDLTTAIDGASIRKGSEGDALSECTAKQCSSSPANSMGSSDWDSLWQYLSQDLDSKVALDELFVANCLDNE